MNSCSSLSSNVAELLVVVTVSSSVEELVFPSRLMVRASVVPTPVVDDPDSHADSIAARPMIDSRVISFLVMVGNVVLRVRLVSPNIAKPEGGSGPKCIILTEFHPCSGGSQG